MPYSEPAFTPPSDFALGGDPLPDKGEVTLAWETRGRCHATVPIDLAREVFGLGGTPDGEVPWKMATLATASPSMLAKLGPYVDDEQVHPVRLAKVNEIDPGEL